ncbi:hypothetical protein JTB14_033637 [Gonioctena quinquepunctata]|nr:hypothetical protein JTB14_033637 [Gonioctena quinquepunctata]
MVVLCLEEEDGRNRKSFIENSGKRRLGHIPKILETKSSEGEFPTLSPYMLDDVTKFHQYFRMLMSAFNLLELKLQENLSKQDTYFRRAITSRHRLAVF